MVGVIIDRTKSCGKCGGVGHHKNICPTPGRLTIMDDGTSKPDPTKDRDYKNRDDAAADAPSTRGTRRQKKNRRGISDIRIGDFKWTKELGPCRHCGKEGYLNRDCKSDKAKAAEEGRIAARAAKVAAGATPAAIYAMDVAFQLASDSEADFTDVSASASVHASHTPTSMTLDTACTASLLPVSPLRVVPADATPIVVPAGGAAGATTLPSDGVALAPSMELALHAIIVLFALLIAYFACLEFGVSADDTDWDDPSPSSLCLLFPSPPLLST